MRTRTDSVISKCVREALSLLIDLLQQIPASALLNRPELTAELQAKSQSQGPYEFACTFYGIKKPESTLVVESELGAPFASSFKSLVSCTLVLRQFFDKGSSSLPLLREEFCQSLALLQELTVRSSATVSIPWSPQEWLRETLDCLDLEVSAF